jgi:hypothetical protein
LARLEAAAEERAIAEHRQAGCCGDPELFALHLAAERRYAAKAFAHRATIEFLRRSDGHDAPA